MMIQSSEETDDDRVSEQSAPLKYTDDRSVFRQSCKILRSELHVLL